MLLTLLSRDLSPGRTSPRFGRGLRTAASGLVLLAALSGCATRSTGIDREAAGATSLQRGSDADLARLLDPTRTPVEVDSAGPRDFGEFDRHSSRPTGSSPGGRHGHSRPGTFPTIPGRRVWPDWHETLSVAMIFPGGRSRSRQYSEHVAPAHAVTPGSCTNFERS